MDTHEKYLNLKGKHVPLNKILPGEICKRKDLKLKTTT
jgi:hypothetical protein